MTGKPSLKCLMAFLLLLINCTYLLAQERVVTGKVKDPQGNPLPGVNVNVWGTRISVTADVTGSFRIPVSSENSVLVFSFVGFLQKEVKVGSDSTFNVSMGYDNADLDQVVVVGYGTSKRRDLTGSVYSVKPNMVTGTPTFNAGEALEGRIPGLDINRTSGAAGAGVNIQLRGNRTLSGTTNGVTGATSQPLVIIDGFQGGSLSDLNPNDIESVEVLKDASSTAIYGWMGANGVIIVTTKRGKDRPKVSYNGYYGVNGYVAYPKVHMGDAYVAMRREAYRAVHNDSLPATDDVLFNATTELPAYKAGQWVDWYSLLNRNGIEQSHTASIQSGGDKTKVFFSTGYYQEQGMLRGNDMKRYNARLNYDQRISNTFKSGFMTQLTWYNINNRTDPMSQVNSLTPLGLPYDSLGNINLYPLSGITNKINPLTDERPGAYTDNQIRGNVIANAYVELTPLPGLSLKTNFGTNITFSRRGQYFDSLTLANFGKSPTYSQITNDFGRFYSWENILTYTHKIEDHSFTITGITSLTRFDDDGSVAKGQRQTLGSSLFYNLNSSEATSRGTSSSFTRYNTMSYAGRLNYSFKGKYLFQATIRTDGVSRLAPGHKWDYFPSAGIGWNIHQENFMSNVLFVNNLKLRATYGVSGNASVQPYGTQSNFTVGGLTFGNVVDPTSFYNIGSSIVANSNVGWEKTAQVNLGLDFALFRSRLYGTIDVYKSKTTDVLMQRPLPPSTGLGFVWQNIGATENKGVELAISSINTASRDFRWTPTVTFTAANEKITSLLYNKDILNAETNSLLIGHPVNSFYNYKKLGIWQLDEAKEASSYKVGTYTYKPGDIKVADLNGDSIIDNNDKTYVGSTVPKWYGGLQNTFTYKGFELSVYILARWGQTINADWMASRFVPDGSANTLSSANYWTPENPTNDFPRPRQGVTSLANYSGYTGYYGLNFIDGSYVKLKTVTLAYTLPASISRKAFSERIRFYVTGNNVFTKAKNHLLKNYDPERGGSENTPLTRQVVFGANVDF